MRTSVAPPKNPRVCLLFFFILISLSCSFYVNSIALSDTVRWSTFVGSRNTDFAQAVAVGDDGSIYVAYSGNEELSDLDFQYGNGVTYVIAKFSSDGKTLLWKSGIGLGYSQPPSPDQSEWIDEHPNQFGYGSIDGLQVDAEGNVVLVGNMAGGSNWPVKNAEQASYGGGTVDGVIMKLSSEGDEILFSTYLGGNSFDRIRDLQIGDDGLIYLVGTTLSKDFPGVQNQVGNWIENAFPGFVSVFTSGGTLQSSVLIGSEYENSVTECRSLAFGKDDTLWVGGTTSAVDLASNENAFQSEHGGVLDGFLIQMNNDLSESHYSSFYGGDTTDRIESIAVTEQGLVVFGGTTFSRNLRMVQSFQDELLESPEVRDGLFVGIFDTQSNDLVMSSYLSGRLEDSFVGLELDELTGDIWIVGSTDSNDIPVFNPVQSQNRAYKEATILTRIGTDGERHLSTYLGGAPENGAVDMAAIPGGGIILVGNSEMGELGAGFPTTLESAFPSYLGGSSDAYLMMVDESDLDASNDLFAHSGIINELPITIMADNSSAKNEANEPSHGINEPGPFRSLWWKWQAPLNGLLEVTTSSYYRGNWDDLFSSSFDSVLSVYTGNELSDLQKLAENDEDPDGRRSSFLQIPVEQGVTYQIAADGVDENSSGAFPISFRFIREVQNDHYQNRILLEGVAPSWQGNNQFATGQTEEFSLGQIFYGKSVWYEWNPQETGVMRISVEAESFSPHALIYLVADSIPQLIPVAYYQQTDPESGERYLNFQAVNDQSYAIVIDGDEVEGGSFSANISMQSGVQNDSFLFAEIIEDYPYQSELVNNSMATREPGEPDLRALGMEPLPAGLSLWWSFEPSTDVSLLWSSEGGEERDVFIGLFQGTDLESLTPPASMRRISQQRIAFEAIAGERYYLMLDQSAYSNPGAQNVSLVEFNPPSFSSMMDLSADRKTLGLPVEGTVGVEYRLEGSSDLETWETLDLFRLETEQMRLELNFDDQIPALFFRLVEVLE